MSKKKEIVPTNPNEEIEKNRIALWLDPVHIEFLIVQSQELSKYMSSEELEKWDIIRFRASAALHKSGYK